MTSVSIDTSEVRTLAADMRDVDARLARWVRPVVKKAATSIKNTMRSDAQQSTYFHFAESINYDFKPEEYEAEIGPEKGSPGSIANIAYFGTPRGGGTVRDPQEAANDELPNFQRELANLADELVLG